VAFPAILCGVPETLVLADARKRLISAYRPKIDSIKVNNRQKKALVNN
jgi:hypothetical protein